MDPIQIALTVLIVAAIWAVVELARVLRSTRKTINSLDHTVAELNGTINEARPMVAKLDGAVDELQPALSQMEPLMKQANVAMEALSADLLEVNGVLRDVSQVTDTAASASSAVSNITDAAASKVHRLFGKKDSKAADHALEQAVPMASEHGGDAIAPDAPADSEAGEEAASANRYYTYTDAQSTSEDSHE